MLQIKYNIDKYKDEDFKLITLEIELAKPEFILIYTGMIKIENKVLKLSDSYIHGEEIPLELIVKIITKDNVQENIISEYINFCQKYDSLKQGLKRKEEILKALRATISYCKEHNILKEFLESKEREVEEIMMSVFTQEQATNMVLKEKYNEGKLEGMEQGIQKGMQQGMQEKTVYIAKMMKEQGLSLDIIVNITGLKEDEINKL